MAKWVESGGSGQSTTHLIEYGPARHERRAMLGPQPRPIVLAWLDTIIFFLFYKKSYMYMYNLY
jgi:hypothetical protein